MDDGLPHHARRRDLRATRRRQGHAIGQRLRMRGQRGDVLGGAAQRDTYLARGDEGLEQVDGRDADDRHRQLHLQHAGVDVAEPLRLVRVVVQAQARNEGFVAADDHHHQQVGDHHHVDQAQHQQHDALFGQRVRPMHQVPQLLEEQEHVDALRHDQAEVERQLQPARTEDHPGEGRKARRRRDGRLHGRAWGKGARSVTTRRQAAKAHDTDGPGDRVAAGDVMS